MSIRSIALVATMVVASLPGAAVALASQLGIARVRDFIAKVTGANSVATEQIAIGAGKGIELSPLDLAAAYTIFPNHGIKTAPTPMRAVYDNETQVKLAERKSLKVVNPGAADTVACMLQAVIGDGPAGRYGTARVARKLPGLDSSMPLAGKTGTAGDTDLWFVGFTPRLVVAVWAGFDGNYPPLKMSKGFEGAGLPLQIWGRFMREVKKYRPELLGGEFRMPE